MDIVKLNIAAQARFYARRRNAALAARYRLVNSGLTQGCVLTDLFLRTGTAVATRLSRRACAHYVPAYLWQ